MSDRPVTLAEDGPSDWSREKPSDVLLAIGLLRLLAERRLELEPLREEEEEA